MAKQDINFGATPNDQSPGVDVVRTAFQKAAANFTELYARSQGDMNKSVYDADNTGVVDSAQKVLGIDDFTTKKYYGTDATGLAGFFDLVIEATNIVFYTDAQPKPLEGTQNVLYIDKTNKKIEVWDGALYQIVAGSYNDTQLRIDFAAADTLLSDRITTLETEPDIIERQPDFISFPLTGFEDTLYVDEEFNTAYLWDDFEGLYFPLNAITSQQIIAALGYTPANLIEQINTSDGTPLTITNKIVTLPEIVAAVHTETVFNWLTGDSQIFTVADSAKVTDVFVQGSRYAKTDEWSVFSATQIQIIPVLDNNDNISIVSAATASAADMTDVISYALSSPTGDLVAGDTDSFMCPYDLTLNNFIGAVVEAPTGSALVVGLKKNTVSVTSSNAIIDAGETTSLTGTAPVITTSSFLKGDLITPTIQQVGSLTTGKSLKIYLEITKL